MKVWRPHDYSNTEVSFYEIFYHGQELLSRIILKGDFIMNIEQTLNKPNYKQKIIELVESIENPVVLMKIYTVVKTHSEILKEKRGRKKAGVVNG